MDIKMLPPTGNHENKNPAFVFFIEHADRLVPIKAAPQSSGCAAVKAIASEGGPGLRTQTFD